ncbi:MAG: hypothetical protein JSS02_00065, partial [Planctomycetes bacterium]|nr:hypothetical protein [Planctomycetota bacterium]
MVERGFDADIVHEVEAISPIAFGRALFEGQGIRFSPIIIRARRDGRVETDVRLMSLPAFARARALAEEFRSRLSKEDFIALCVCGAESQAIMQALEAGHTLIEMSASRFAPCVVADRGASDETVNAAMAKLKLRSEPGHPGQIKPWWKFW